MTREQASAASVDALVRRLRGHLDGAPGGDAAAGIHVELALGLLETAQAIVLVLDPDRRIRYVNPFFERLSGYALAEIEGLDWFATFLPERVHAEIGARFDGAITGDATRGQVNPILTRHGPRMIEWHDRTFRDAEGGAVALLAIGHDITALHEAGERALWEKAAALDSSAAAIAIGDLRGNLTYVNPAMLALWRLGDPSEALGRSALEFWADPSGAAEALSSLLEGQPWTGRLVARRTDGTDVPVRVAAHPVRDPDGTVIATMASFIDVSQEEEAGRRIAEAGARVAESEELYRAIFEQGAFGMSVLSIDGRLEQVNDRLGEMLDYLPEELVGVHVLDLLPGPARAPVATRLREMADGTRDQYTSEAVLRAQDGHFVPVDAAVSPLHIDGNPAKILVIVSDATERKAADAALRRSDASLRRAEAMAHVGNWEWDPKSGRTRWSDELYAIYGLAKRPEPPSADEHLMMVDERDRAALAASMEEVARTGAATIEYRIARRDGATRVIRAESALSPADAVAVFPVHGFAQDITEQRAAEERIEAQLREKEVLLREIHHRVKNNLQIVSSLLQLQANRIDDPVSRAILQESQSRVRSMALVHDQLYRSPDLARIDFAGYLAGLLDSLRTSLVSDVTGITIRSEVQPVTLSVESAVPCGLIVNELVTNALKHAFPSGGPGEIVVSLSPAGADRVVLSVHDSGIGLPDGFDAADAGSLGLTIVAALAGQLGGAVAYRHDQGTEARVTFPTPTGSADPMP